jgi:transcriptional regulator with XRE-family HTH domain
MRPKRGVTRSRLLVGEAVKAIRLRRHLRQLDLANAINVDHSLVSRIETGQANVDPALLVAVRRALRPTEAEWKWLETCVARCALDVAGVTDALTVRYQDLLDISASSLRAAVELRACGNSPLAANTTYPVARVLVAALDSCSMESTRKVLAAEVCELLFHEAKCYLDYLPVGGIARLAMPVVSRLAEVARALPTARNELLVQVLREGLLYFDEKYLQADRVARRVLALEVESEWRPEIVRAAAINAGHLGDELSLYRHEKEMRRIIAGGVSPADHVFMLEGLARGYARLGLSRAVDVIEEVWEVQLDTTVQSTLRYVQKVRAHLEVNNQLGRTHDRYISSQAKNGLRIARSMGYERYVADVVRLTEEVG